MQTSAEKASFQNEVPWQPGPQQAKTSKTNHSRDIVSSIKSQTINLCEIKSPFDYYFNKFINYLDYY